MQVTISLFFQAFCLLQGTFALVQPPFGASLKEDSEDAILGSQIIYTDDLTSDTVTFTEELYNNAKSVQGVANAGSRLMFARRAALSNSNLTQNTFTVFNEATSNQNTAVSGSQVAFDDIQDSYVAKNSLTFGNEASVVGKENGGQLAAVSGTQTLARNANESVVAVKEDAKFNTASNNYNGEAVAGVDQFFGNITHSYIQRDNNALNNFATAGDGRAVAGVQTGVKNLVDSTITTQSASERNQAKSVNGNAVAGIENSFGSIFGSFPGGHSTAIILGEASNNVATAVDGKAVAGIATNVKDIHRSVLTQRSYTHDNKAVASGAGDKPQQSIAGVGVAIKDVNQSTVTLDLTSSGNHALNYYKDPHNESDAIAGSEVVIGYASRAVINVLANSTNNLAYAQYGDAIAGNKVDFNDTSSSTIVVLDLEAANNFAEAQNGEAIVDNDVTIGGSAKTIGGR